MKQYVIRSTVVMRGEIVQPILVTDKINTVLEEVESLLRKENTQGINIEVREVAVTPNWGFFAARVPEAVPA